MSTLSIANSSFPDKEFIVPDALKSTINSFIHELDTQIKADVDNEFTDADYNHTSELLKAALRITGNDPARIALIKQAFDACNVNNNILGKLITNDHVSLAHLLIDLKIAEIFVKDGESPLKIAVDQSSQELISHLLKFVDPNANLDSGTALYHAVEKADKEAIKQLLQTGANPHLKSPMRSTPFEYAVIFNDISLINLFFDSTICRFNVDLAHALEQVSLATQYKFETDEAQKKGYGSQLSKFTKIKLDNDYNKEHRTKEHRTKYYDWQKSLALTLPPLVNNIPCYAPYVARRDKAINCILDPLLNTPPSISFYINPLMQFISKEMREDPEFTITISKAYKDSNLGEYDPSTGKINLYIRETEQPFKDLPDIQDTTLIHEICHKICDKVPQKFSLLKEAVDLDARNLETDGWKNCHPIVKYLLRHVKRQFPNEDLYEEYLVRTMEILYTIAYEDRTRTLKDIKNMIKKDLPETFKYIQNEFWVNLSVYNIE